MIANIRTEQVSSDVRTEQILKDLIQGMMRPIDTAEIARVAAREAIRCYRQELERTDGKRLLTKKQADDIYGRSVIDALVKRGFLRPRKFDMTEVTEDGETYMKPKGNVYFKLTEIEAALDAGNLLQGIV